MSKLNENQKRIIDEITNEFLEMNKKKTSNGDLIDLDFLFKEKKEWEEKILMLEKKNKHFLTVAIEECRIVYNKLSSQLMGIADVSVRYNEYGGYILIEKGRDEFRINYEAPQTIYVINDTFGENFRYADKFIVRGYVSRNHSIECDSTEEFFSNEYIKNRLYKLLK